MCCVFYLFGFVLYCQFLWIVLFWLPLRYSLMFNSIECIHNVRSYRWYTFSIIQCLLIWSVVSIVLEMVLRKYDISISVRHAWNGAISVWRLFPANMTSDTSTHCIWINDIIDPFKHTLFISYMFTIKLKYLYTLYLNFSQSDMGISVRYDHYYVDSMNGRYK